MNPHANQKHWPCLLALVLHLLASLCPASPCLPDRNGKTVTYGYDARERLSTITDK